MSTVLGKPTCRQAARPAVQQDVPTKYWYPRYQEWLTLTEYTYLKNKENHNDKSNAASV
jgi:hypothetical protein